MKAAKSLTRTQFRGGAGTDEAQLREKLAEAEEVITFLKRNLVQAVKVNEAGQENLFRTNFHLEIVILQFPCYFTMSLRSQAHR